MVPDRYLMWKLANIHVFSFIWPCNSLARCSDWTDCDPIKVPWPQMTLHLPFSPYPPVSMCSGPCQRPKLTNAISRWAIQLTTWRNQIHVKQLFNDLARQQDEVVLDFLFKYATKTGKSTKSKNQKFEIKKLKVEENRKAKNSEKKFKIRKCRIIAWQVCSKKSKWKWS